MSIKDLNRWQGGEHRWRALEDWNWDGFLSPVPNLMVSGQSNRQEAVPFHSVARAYDFQTLKKH
jgi:hypothetical protein